MDKYNSTTLVIKDFQGVKIHSFISPYPYAANATHVIETAHELVVVDTQFLNPMAQGFRAYVDSLGKPVNRIFISHGHPDHYFGLASAFSDCNAYSLAGVNQIIAEWGPQMIKNQKPTFGDLIPDAMLVPQHSVAPDTSEVIDGLTYAYEVVEGAESEAQLLIKLPELGTVIAQDLVYSGVHIWLGMGWFEKWATELQRLADTEGYDYILAGHGLPCTKDEIHNNIRYIQTAQRLFEDGLGKDAFKARLLEAYPHRESPMMFDLYLGFLFGEMGSH
ncbi:MAG: MBL fold metallo-hydrolase [Haliscomenobacter sp.]|uniref:MBL fold metallo-hydrolase n=1 Tax=Haliscomenobacter sp. TaxID=2717303 RepID=UPI0029B471BF|nr:MBL fold metallo-hydrolase [Haliscomenobacter sp.]MDX2070318.1 MBL fold metallo-hydrolase [Haliscomenobacter sp.]